MVYSIRSCIRNPKIQKDLKSERFLLLLLFSIDKCTSLREKLINVLKKEALFLSIILRGNIKHEVLKKKKLNHMKQLSLQDNFKNI
jgi:hypothetical protein